MNRFYLSFYSHIKHWSTHIHRAQIKYAFRRWIKDSMSVNFYFWVTMPLITHINQAQICSNVSWLYSEEPVRILKLAAQYSAICSCTKVWISWEFLFHTLYLKTTYNEWNTSSATHNASLNQREHSWTRISGRKHTSGLEMTKDLF